MSSFIKVNRDESIVKENTGGGSYLSKSGIYPITLKFASVSVNEHNARSIDFNVIFNNNESTLYGLKLDNNDGSENYMYPIFNNLAIIAGLDNVNEPEEQEHAVGKDKELRSFMVLDDFSDLPCYVRVQQEYSKYNNEIKSRLTIKGFYREDKASAYEITKDLPAGTQFEKDQAYATKITYKDGLTAEEVTAWEEAKKAGKTGGVKPATTTPVKANAFRR
jgi:hypothetical protein